MPILYALLAIAAGALNTIQAGCNTTLSKTLGQPIIAALIVTLVNIAAYLIAALFVGVSLPSSSKIMEVPWWGWIGGVLGGAYVLAMIFFAERLGAAAFTGLTVTAAIITSVALDHFGLVGFSQHVAGYGRIIGCCLMVGGVLLVSIF